MTYSAQQNKRGIPIFVNGRVIGEVRGDTFYKQVARAHQLRRPRAWAFDVTSLTDATAAGAEYVELRIRETGAILRTSIDTIREHGRAFNRGYGDQIFLTLKFWTTPDGAPVVKPFELRRPKPLKRPQATQPSLFAEVGA